MAAATVRVDGKSIASPGLGLMSIGNIYGPTNEEESKELLRKALEIGNVFWDTADAYGGGTSERIIGEVLRETGARDKVYLASKFGIEWDRKDGSNLNRGRADDAYIQQCVEETNKRLGTVPDLLYQHRQDQSGEVEVEQVYATLAKLQKEGKVKALGVSEVSPETLRRILKVAKITALQIEYSPFERDIETNGLLDICRENGIIVVAYSPVGRGLLTGKWKSREEVKGVRQGNFPRYSEENFDHNYALAQKLQDFGKKRDATAAQVAIAWVSAQGDDIIPIPGTSKTKNMVENFESRNLRLSKQDLQELNEIVRGHKAQGHRYPEVMRGMLEKGMK